MGPSETPFFLNWTPLHKTVYWRHRIVLTALITVNTVGHTNLFPHCWIILRMHTIYQPTVFNIRGPHCRFQYFYRIEISEHLKDFQSRGMRWVYHRGITSASRVAPYFHVWWCTLWAAQSKSHYTSAITSYHNQCSQRSTGTELLAQHSRNHLSTVAPVQQILLLNTYCPPEWRSMTSPNI